MKKTNQAMNDAIRRAAGRLPETQTETTQQVGHGSADGAAKMKNENRLDVNTVMNQAIRDAHKGA